MILAALTLLSSLGCILVSLLALGLVVKHIYRSEDDFIQLDGYDAVLISGCDSGIGLELAKHFHKSFKFKIICGFLSPNHSNGYKELERLSNSDASNRLILVHLNITSDEDIRRTVATIDKLKQNSEIRQLVALVNNAGTMIYGEFDWLTWDHIQSQIDVNLIGTIRLTRAVIPYIIESKGRIINVTSVNDTTVFPGLSIYSATKGAISVFSRGLGYELRKFGAHVVSVRLGDFARLTNIMAKHPTNRDDMWSQMGSKKQMMYKDFFNEFNEHLLKNYGMTSPKEFAESSLFSDFKRALLSKNPPTTITCTSLGFRIFYSTIELTPVWLQYHILDVLIRFGFNWKAPRIEVRTINHE